MTTIFNQKVWSDKEFSDLMNNRIKQIKEEKKQKIKEQLNIILYVPFYLRLK